jgi:two-component sensor histidine kinase
VVGDATLVASELVGNAVRYGAPLPGGVLDVSWRIEPDRIRLRVSDGGGPSVPVRHDAGPEDVRGRGLAIVAAIARDWGVELSGNGFGPMSTVWVDLPVKG